LTTTILLLLLLLLLLPLHFAATKCFRQINAEMMSGYDFLKSQVLRR